MYEVGQAENRNSFLIIYMLSMVWVLHGVTDATLLADQGPGFSSI